MIRFKLATRVLALCLLAAWPSARAETSIKDVLAAVVGLEAKIPRDARTARFLGTERSGSGVVIDSNGLVVTIGYLILEASSVTLKGPDGRQVPAKIIAYDYDTGFGLVRALAPLNVKPMALGDARKLAVKDTVLLAGYGGVRAMAPAVVVSRRDYSGYWEYLLENAIFTAPFFPTFGGAAMISAEGKLLGIGSLAARDAVAPGIQSPGNMFVPIDRLKPILGDLLSKGRSSLPTKPWLGMFTQRVHGRLIVTATASAGPARKAGIKQGDIVLEVAGQKIRDQADFYRKVWALGRAGVMVSMTVLQGAGLKTIKIKSADRYDYLKLRRSH